MSTLEAAVSYVRRGWSTIPVGGDKRPLLKRWAEYQKRLPAEAELQDWYSRWPNGGVAIVTGRVSGLVVLDVDPRNGGKESLQAMMDAGELTQAELDNSLCKARTQSGGLHYYFLYPEGMTVKMKPGFRPGLDLKSDGGYCVAPPTVVPGTDRGWVWVTP